MELALLASFFYRGFKLHRYSVLA